MPEPPNSIVMVKTHHTLRTVKQDEFPACADQVLRDADAGIQTAITGSDGKTIQTVIGMNGHRFFQDPDPDPLDEIEQLACRELAAPKR